MNELNVNLPSSLSDFKPANYQRARYLANDHNADLPPCDPEVHQEPEDSQVSPTKTK